MKYRDLYAQLNISADAFGKKVANILYMSEVLNSRFNQSVSSASFCLHEQSWVHSAHWDVREKLVKDSLPPLIGCKWNQGWLFLWGMKIRVLATTIFHWAEKQAWLWARHSCSPSTVWWSASPQHSWPLWLLDRDNSNPQRQLHLLYDCYYGDFSGLNLFHNYS